MTSIYHSLFFGILLVCFCNADFIIYPVHEVVTLPSNGVLKSSVVLSCNFAPPDYLHKTFWITPSGLEVNMTTMNQHYSMSQGRHSQQAMSTTLQINNLSYLDSGNYSCVVNSSNAMELGMNIVQARTTVKLRLKADIIATENKIIILNNEEHVNLSCEMSQYIPPDKALQWIGNNISPLRNSEKYTITFQNGSQLNAQNGDNRQSPSRLSILTIHNPSKQDSGQYLCTLSGTSQSASIHLEVGETDSGVDYRVTIHDAGKRFGLPRCPLTFYLDYVAQPMTICRLNRGTSGQDYPYNIMLNRNLQIKSLRLLYLCLAFLCIYVF